MNQVKSILKTSNGYGDLRGLFNAKNSLIEEQ